MEASLSDHSLGPTKPISIVVTCSYYVSQRTLTMFVGVVALHVMLCRADIGVPQLLLSGKQACLNIK